MMGRVCSLMALLLSLSTGLFAQFDSLYCISLREDFADPKHFGDSLQCNWLFVQGGNMQVGEAVASDELLKRVSRKRVLILVHGFATPLRSASIQYGNALLRIRSHLDEAYDVVIGLAWPGMPRKGGKLAYVSRFFRANAKAKRSGKRLAPFIETLSQSASAIDVFAHSMGAKVSMYLLKKTRFAVRNVFLMAPSIWRKSLLPGHKYHEAPGRLTGKLLVFHSVHDPVYAGSRKVAMGHSGAFIPEADYPDKVVNVDCSKVMMPTAQPEKYGYFIRHGMYYRDPAVFRFMRAFLKGKHLDQVYQLPLLR